MKKYGNTENVEVKKRKINEKQREAEEKVEKCVPYIGRGGADSTGHGGHVHLEMAGRAGRAS